MADNEQELLSDEEINTAEMPCDEDSRNCPIDTANSYNPASVACQLCSHRITAQAQVVKLKAMGYKSPEEVEVLIAEKAQKQMCIDDLTRQLREFEANCVKWDRELVAKLCFSCNYLTSSNSWFQAKKPELERAYKQADQLKEILTGEE